MLFMPFPCHAVPLRFYNVSLPFDLHSAAVSDSHLPCHAYAILRTCRSSQGHSTARPSRDGCAVLWPFLLIYTVRPCLIHTFHAMPMPYSDHAVLLKATAQHGRLSTAVLCCVLEKNGMFRAWHGHGMASVNQTRPHRVNQMGNTHSKPLAARHGRGTAWARHAMCESALL